MSYKAKWKKSLPSIVRWISLLVLLLARPCTLLAQQQPDSSDAADSSDKDSSSSADSQTSAAGSQTSDSQPDPFAGQSTTTTLDTGQTIDHSDGNRISPLRWGHLSLLSADAFYDHDSNSSFAATNPPSSDALAARLLALYSIGSDRASLDIQYRPFVLVSASEQQADLLGSQVVLRTHRRLSSRWLATFFEIFSYAPDRGRFIDETITPNFSTGEVLTESFLANALNELRNDTTGSLAYRMSLRDAVVFHAQYEFVDQTNATRPKDSLLPTEFHITNTPGIGVSWTHVLSAYHNFGLSYNYGHQYVGGFQDHSQFHTWLITYNQWIQPTLRLHLEVGPSLQIHDDGRPNYTTVQGSAVLTKMFHESRLAAMYSRDYSYAGVVTDTYHDRFDAFYSRSFGPRWDLSGGGGYLDSHATLGPHVQSRNLWIRASHRLSLDWGLFLSFSNGATSGSEPYASRYLVIAGVHWAPASE